MLHSAAGFRILRGGGRVRARSNLVLGSKNWCPRTSFAASVSSDEPQLKIKRKHVPKDERRAMVESSVNKYRSKNLGKFPTASYVMKEVGGSYYVVKKMVQELEYNSKSSLSNEGIETRSVSVPVDNVLSEEITKDIVTGDGSKNVDTEAQFLKGEVEEITTSDSMKSEDFEDKATCEILLDIDGSNSKVEVNQPLPELSLLKKPADFEEETLCESVDFDGSKSKSEPHPSPEILVPKSKSEPHPSPEILVPRKPEDTEEGKRYESLPDIDGPKSKSVVHQPFTEFSSARKPEDVDEKTLSESVLDFDGSESKTEEHHSLPEYSIPMKPENTIKEEPCQTVPVVDGSKSNGEVQQPLTEISRAKKLEDVKEEIPYESMLGFEDLKSKSVEHQPSPEYSIPKKPDNTKQEEPYQTVAIDGSQSKAQEHKNSESESTEKQTQKKIQMKKSLWGNLKSVAEGLEQIATPVGPSIGNQMTWGTSN